MRAFAIQYRHEIEDVTSYASYRERMEGLGRRYVIPGLASDKVPLVVFGEHIALAMLCAGSRGRAAREAATSGRRHGNADALTVFGLAAAGYEQQIDAYRSLYPELDDRKAVFTAATDTLVRGFAGTFSRLARSLGAYVVASNNLAPFRFSRDAGDIAAFADPDLADAYEHGAATGVWVASSSEVWNQALCWGPEDVRAPEAGAGADPASPDYDPRTNLLFANRKVPLTELESALMGLDEGDLSPENTGPFRLPGVPDLRFGFAISLPAFMYGNRLGESEAPADPCGSADTWMRCLNARGVDVVLQPEANSHPWAAYGADGDNWQALTWGASTLRAVVDPTVGFRHVVCAHVVGNLADIPFDGQTAITMRGRDAPGRAYAGAARFIEGRDEEWTRPYSGEHPEFCALAPWVLEDDAALDPAADRERLAARALELAPNSGSPRENAYLETAVFADLG